MKRDSSVFLQLIRSIIFIVLIVIATNSGAQGQEKDSLKRKHLGRDLLIIGGSYTASMLLLNELWYKDFDRQPFTIFNDNPEWLQVDKLGHVFTSYHLTKGGKRFLQKYGISDQKAVWLGALGSFLMMTPIELLDAYSAAYGASPGDLAANIGGSLLLVGQFYLGSEEYFTLKYSFLPSQYASERPSLLGSNLSTQWLKDYNGQTYWVSLNMDKLINVWPKWINIGIGYGGNGMVYARKEVNASQGFDAYRQYYLALDPDLSHIQSKKKWVNILLRGLDMIHIPAPALEFNKNGASLTFN